MRLFYLTEPEVFLVGLWGAGKGVFNELPIARWEEDTRDKNRTMQRVIKVKVQDGNPIKRVNVRYRSDIYNRIMINSLINRDKKRYLGSQCGPDLIMKLERVVGEKVWEEIGEGMDGLSRVMER